MIIAFEGIDFTGKDTHMELIYKWLRNMWVTNGYLHQFPKKGDTLINRHLMGELKLSDEELAVEFLREMVKEKNEIQLESERGVVMLNRYFYSTIAYEGSKLGVKEMINDIKKLGLPKPDYVILLDGDPGTLAERSISKDTIEKNIEKQKKVRNVYKELAAERPFGAKWIIINSEKSVRETHDELKKTIKDSVIQGQ